MEFEVARKELVYVRVAPDNAKQIEDASFCEREGFGTGLDPQELPPVLQFIAKYGYIWLQYAVENGKRIPTGVMELISLPKALEYRPGNIDPGEYDLSISPFNVIMENQERVFASVRQFAKDQDIVYHHGIAMSRRGKGYGTLLLRYALENTPSVKNHFVVCFPDAAQIDEKTKGLNLAPNEDSFTVHLKAGFVLAGVVDPPVYDETLTYYSFIRPAKKIKCVKNQKQEFRLNLADGSPTEVLNGVRMMTDGPLTRVFLGVDYSKETHEIQFVLAERT